MPATPSWTPSVAEVIERLVKVLGAAVNDDLSPRVALDSEYIGEMMFTNRQRDRYAEGEPEVLPWKGEPLAQTQAKFRFAFDAKGKPHPKLKTPHLRRGALRGDDAPLLRDPTMVAFGEENRDWGGAFGVYRGLTEALPYPRLFNSPISEGAIVGAAVGYALSGGRVVAELMYCDFMGRAGDEIFNQMAKWQAMSGGCWRCRWCCASRWAPSTARSTRRTGPRWWRTSRAEGDVPRHALRRQGHAQPGPARQRPGVFFESQRLYPNRRRW
jgi:hypothetical protein